MSDDYIGIKVNGVLYVKLEDARKLREGWDEADKRIDEWRDAANEALRKCCGWQAPIQEGEKPKDVLDRLVHFLISTTHDQETSEHIADMIHAARREGMEKAAQQLEELHRNHKYNPKTGEGREHDVGYYRALAEGAAHIRAAAKEGKP